jgi:serine/threonine protein kinase/WD40 repeat protein
LARRAEKEMSLAAGAKLGPYEIQSPLGAGGMGEVYRARDTRLERTVAIKVLPAALADNPQARERFVREARAVSKLNHPHICTLFDVGDEGSTHFLVMEYLEGETLAQRIERGPLPLDQCLKFAGQIADAISKAHRAGIVHRDLKPSNIFLAKQGLKLLDFGLAKDYTGLTNAASPKSDSATTLADTGTAAGAILGTYPYMSPEQLEGKPADSRCDIFAFGAVLYEMLTGQRAFPGKSQASVIAAILERNPRPISELLSICPPSLDRLVSRCLAKDPDERWQSAFDLKLKIEEIGSESLSAGSKETEAAAGVAGSRLPWVIASLAILLALGLAFRMLRSNDSRPAIYSSIVPPVGISFQIDSDLGAAPVLAPDGSGVVFGAGDEIWYRSLRDGTQRAIPEAKGGNHPFWSPDSRSIGFFSEGKLKTLEVGGGATKTICDAPNPRGGSWSTSGIIVFTPNTRDLIYQVPASGGTPSPITHLDAKLHTSHRWPFFLPDGNHFLYLATNHVLPQDEQNGVHIASLDGKMDRPLVSTLAGAVYASGRLFWVKEGRLLSQPMNSKDYTLSGEPAALAENVVTDIGVWRATFSVSENEILLYQTGERTGMSRLEWVDRSGKHLGFAGDKSVFFGPRISRDGNRILVVTGDPGADVWVFDSNGQNRNRLTFESMSTSEAVWSPDESQFAFGLGRPNKEFTVQVKSSSGSGPATVIEKTEEVNSPSDWSPDGKYLVTDRFANGRGLLWLIPLHGGEPREALDPNLVTPGMQSSGQFSPNGKWLAFTNGVPQVFIVPFPKGSGMWQVSAGHGKWPRWRRDGREIYYLSDKNELMAVTVHENGTSLELGTPIRLFSFRPSLRLARQGMISYDVTSDGKKFLLNSAADENTRPLTLVTNWLADLKKK